ncbi:hypothetical protein LSUCC0387_05245 [Rhodobacterales bacterium LSUCC0387]|nr:hypothetical protein [Rhodobacterales bacterium LSUCC0387]
MIKVFFLKTLTMAIVMFLITEVTSAASFDCSRSQTFVEKTICSVPELSYLDELMANNYWAMRGANIGDGAMDDLMSTQREWLATRDQCENVDCLLDQYLQRIEQICMYPVIKGVFPDCREAY